MEGKGKRKRKRRRDRGMPKQRMLFPILLAAVCSQSHINRSLIKKCLNKLFLSILHVNFSPFLSLFPVLLKSNCAEIVCKSLEIVGVSAITSFEMNEQVAMDDGIVKCLLSLSGSSKREIAIAACNAVLDLSTTLIGCCRLLEFSAIDNLLLYFIQESKTLDDVKLIEEDEYQILLLHCAITLVNSCTIEQLQNIPPELSGKFTAALKILWGAVHKQRLCSPFSRCDQIDKFCIGKIATTSLTESIFRLSINHRQHPGWVDFENVKKNIFELGEVSIEQFFSERWEACPMLIRNMSTASTTMDSIFGPFVQYLDLKKDIPTFIPLMLKGTISCPAIASDDLDILHVVDEIKNRLSYPIIYNQDIRVVKTQHGGRELHYFQDRAGSRTALASHALSIDDMMKCEEAFNQGYSIALRGMEFRYQSIAAAADRVASLFGQPSAGVNLYLTPPNAQGLARHSDDHCVFVCQLMGAKEWTVYPRPDSQLPRLYEPFNSLNDLKKEDQKINGCQRFLVKEGDILYIPRGFPHEARTAAAASKDVDNGVGPSLHLTLAIEIEPPFEWEGFMQVAVYCWDKMQSLALQHKLCDSMAWNLHVTAVKLLHIAIKLIGNVDPTFRKASLVGALALVSHNTSTFQNQLETFKVLANRIASKSKFSDAVEHVKDAIQRNEDPLEHIRWMNELLEISTGNHGYPLDSITSISNLLEAAFVQVKSRFCSEVTFGDVEQQYAILLDKYGKVRKQYINGMLSLHSALRCENCD